MKPNFALGLTQDGITLWQRGTSGWLRVGAVSPDAPEMDAQMRDLAKIASALAPDGVRTKLVVPDEQILFCDVQVSARNPDMQAHEIRAQLAGRTPYPVEELDFDWTVKDGTAHVAVVARETVIEAEDFATLYGLNPVSTVAAPEKGRFAQEPFFGTTRGARDLIGDPARLERDRDILKETGTATLPDPELVATETKSASSEDAAKPAAQEPPAPAPSVPDPAKAAEPAAKQAPAAQAKPAKDSPTTPPAQTPPAASKPVSSSAVDDRKASILSKLKAAKADSDSAESRSAPTGLTAALNARQAKGKTPEPAAATSTQQKESSSDAAVAFRSRRAPASADKQAGIPKAAAQDRKPGKDLLGALRNRLGTRPGLSKLSFGSLGKSPTAPKAPAKTETPTPDAVKATGAAPQATAATSMPTQQTKPPGGATATKAQGTGDKARDWPRPAQETKAALPRRKDPLDMLHARANSGGGQSEADRMTIFGARNHDTSEAKPARRALLVLGGVGLLLLAVAIWVFYFTTSNPGISPQLSQDITPVEEPAPLAADLTDPTDGALAQEAIEAALGLEDAAQQLPLDAAESELAADGQTSASPSPPASAANDLTAGRIAGLRSAALLPPQEAVPLPEPPSAPAPFGADPLPPLREDVAADAAVPDEATGVGEDALLADDAAPAGSGLPEGEEALDITVTEGTPPVTPPTRPEALAPEPEIAATPEPEAAPETAAEPALPDQSAADPGDESLLEIEVTEGSPPVTPPARPAGLTPEPPTAPEQPADAEPDALIQPLQQDTEDSSSADQAGLNTPPPGGVALTALRPATRPADLAEAVAAAAAQPAFDASQLAVAASLRPGSRPGQFAAVVQRALRAAQPRTTTQTPAVASAPAPEAAIQTARAAVPAAPPIPASASVAREATQARAINLRQINLIGVMGTSSARRALVRLSNGRVVAVRVGEQLDGGQVTAIGENELRYVRRGRDVVLRIAS